MLALNLAITCLTNPRAGREAFWPAPALFPADRVKRILVVGGGPAGMEAAATAAERRHDVSIWERSDRLGGALNWTEKMPLRTEFGKLLTHQAQRLADAGVAVSLANEATPDNLTEAGADRVIWAAGVDPKAQVLRSGG
ncbi:FAD-dependent oxidoreductase [Tateyamaria sp.]|uniref:FAD-dependent oxidoreductase n=1 Tax=Tateyamaria sp. TaxID=1929288 RepID=UPI003B227E4A